MVIKKPSVITLDNGQEWFLINAMRINGKDFGFLAELPKEEKTSLMVGVAEMQIVEGQAKLAFYEGPDSDQLMEVLLKIPAPATV